MLAHHSQLAMFDSDRQTFGNRTMEFLKFLESNVHLYRKVIESSVNAEVILQQDETKEPLDLNFKALRYMVPKLTNIFGMVLAYSAGLVLLESYLVGHVLAIGAVFLFGVLTNGYHLQSIIINNFSNTDANGRDDPLLNVLTQEERTAKLFGEEFWRK